MRWFWIMAGLGLVYMALNNMSSTYVTATIAARPMDLVRGDVRVPVWLPQSVTEQQPEGTARMTIGTGAFLGIRMAYALPGGGLASCRHSWSSVSCRDGWKAEFPGAE